MPEPLIRQLKVGGVLVMPVGENLQLMGTMLTKFTKLDEKNQLETQDIFTVNYPYLTTKEE